MFLPLTGSGAVPMPVGAMVETDSSCSPALEMGTGSLLGRGKLLDLLAFGFGYEELKVVGFSVVMDPCRPVFKWYQELARVDYKLEPCFGS